MTRIAPRCGPLAPSLLSSAALACVLALTGAHRVGAQEIIIREPRVDQPRFVVIDDMVIEAERLAEVSRPQGALLDFRAVNGYWDFGVIPYQLSPEFTDAQRQNIEGAMAGWMSVAPILFVPRSTQSGYALFTKLDSQGTIPSPCFSNVGQFRRGVSVQINLGSGCANAQSTAFHEIGHLLGLFHEQSRSDRDQFVEIDLSNVAENAKYAFNKMTFPVFGPYDFASIMHYGQFAFAIDRARPVIIPREGYASYATVMGTARTPSDTDHASIAFLYNGQLRASRFSGPTERERRTFDRSDFLLAMERLNALYMSRFGLNRPAGLSVQGRPDFLGIAQWVFDIYLGARSAGWSAEGAFDIVTAAVTQSDEWKQKNPSRTPLVPAAFRPSVTFERSEFLSVLNQLDAFYRAQEGLQRPGGLSINGGPDFAGIATWVFDVYLNERLAGTSANAAWVLTQNAIRNTDEWRTKH